MSLTAYPSTTQGPTGSTGPTGVTGATGPVGGYQWTMVSKSTDQAVINTTTLQDDTALQFAMSAATKYRVRAFIFCDPTAAGDWKYDFNAPASPTLIRTMTQTAVSQGQMTNANGAAMAATLPAATLAAVTADQSCLRFNMVFFNLNSGTFKFRFAQGTAVNDAGAIVRAGSYIEYSVA